MSSEHHFKMNGRIWVDTPAGKVLGHGRIELLERIHASGVDQLPKTMIITKDRAEKQHSYSGIELENFD